MNRFLAERVAKLLDQPPLVRTFDLFEMRKFIVSVARQIDKIGRREYAQTLSRTVDHRQCRDSVLDEQIECLVYRV